MHLRLDTDLSVVGTNKKVAVSFNVKNTGKVTGAEVAQVYVSQEKSITRPSAANFQCINSGNLFFINPSMPFWFVIFIPNKQSLFLCTFIYLTSLHSPLFKARYAKVSAAFVSAFIRCCFYAATGYRLHIYIIETTF